MQYQEICTPSIRIHPEPFPNAIAAARKENTPIVRQFSQTFKAQARSELCKVSSRWWHQCSLVVSWGISMPCGCHAAV